MEEEAAPVAVKKEDAGSCSGDRNLFCIDVTGDNDWCKLHATHDEVAQAFSHFSYIHSGRKALICDLQGTHVRRESMLYFTDPVIHYHDVVRE
mmetsp:Transcript_1147/g.2962  ORF Transcript_1147/g.2962 Transcript_1147/m.2962 type:complete len:93 (+) Transcript_1147:1645-1923(+)